MSQYCIAITLTKQSIEIQLIEITISWKKLIEIAISWKKLIEITISWNKLI